MGWNATLGRNTRGGRKKRVIEYSGQTKTLDEWAADLKMSRHTIRMRLRRGWTVAEALGFEEHELVTGAELAHPNQFDDGTGVDIRRRQAEFIQALINHLEATNKWQPAIVAKEVSIPVDTIYRWRKTSDDFAAAYDEVKEASNMYLEDYLTDIVHNPEDHDRGLRRPGWSNLVMFKVKGEMPDKYRDTPPQTNININQISLKEALAAEDAYWKIQQQKQQVIDAEQPKLINPPGANNQ